MRRIEVLPFKPFEFNGYLGKRRIVSFGWRYDYAGRPLRASEPLPDFPEPLRQRAAAVAGLEVQHLQQALVTEYDAGVTIGWHRNKPMFEDVVALSFLSAGLRRKPARHEWEHSIPPVEGLRYSVTFRSFGADFSSIQTGA